MLDLSFAEVTYTVKGTKSGRIKANAGSVRNITLNLRKLAKNISGKNTVEVGWFSDQTYENGEKISDIAALQEYGGEGNGGNRIPPRPFVRPAVAENEKKWKRQISREIKRQIKNDTADIDIAEPLNRLGLVIKGDVQTAIMQVFSPPLAPYTVKKRMEKRGIKSKDGLSEQQTASLEKPLVDTGTMIHSIRHEVYKK